MQYGDKRDYPKIETWHAYQDGAEGRPMVTTWARTVKEAREMRAKTLGVDVAMIRGRRVKP